MNKQIKKKIMDIFHHIHWGQFLISKVQFLFTLLILVKVYNFSLVTNIIILTSGILIVWLSGYIWVNHFKDEFQSRFFKGVFDKDKTNKT